MNRKPKKSFRDGLRSSRDFIKYTNIAIRMIVIILVGVYAGIKLDDYFNMDVSLFTLIFSLASVVLAMYVIIREISSK